METIYFKRIREISQERENLEKRLNIKIKITGRRVDIEGSAVDEYDASLILEAMNFGFSSKKALLLKDEQMIFVKIPIKNFTRRKNLWEVRSRIIGTEGKTRRTIEEISGCIMIIKENLIGIIGPIENIDKATMAITNLIRGSKQANVYRFLERMNAVEKAPDLGLKIDKK